MSPRYPHHEDPVPGAAGEIVLLEAQHRDRAVPPGALVITPPPFLFPSPEPHRITRTRVPGSSLRLLLLLRIYTLYPLAFHFPGEMRTSVRPSSGSPSFSLTPGPV